MATYDGMEYKNVYEIVSTVFSVWYFVAFYVLCMIFLALHLSHGFSSAFQSLGLNHKKYTPFIDKLGLIYSILIPLGFAIIPIFMFLGIKL